MTAPPRRHVALLVSVAGAMLVALDGTVLLVAQPGPQRVLGADVARVQWTSTGYLLAVASLLVLAGLSRLDATSTWWAMGAGFATVLVTATGTVVGDAPPGCAGVVGGLKRKGPRRAPEKRRMRPVECPSACPAAGRTARRAMPRPLHDRGPGTRVCTRATWPGAGVVAVPAGEGRGEGVAALDEDLAPGLAGESAWRSGAVGQRGGGADEAGGAQVLPERGRAGPVRSARRPRRARRVSPRPTRRRRGAPGRRWSHAPTDRRVRRTPGVPRGCRPGGRRYAAPPSVRTSGRPGSAQRVWKVPGRSVRW
ncbi:hypothetical protein SAZ_02660 [Streptomyces noursei ZPM]|nr:hypothetical protein SAZ_02660 [Streptomyces noursei ZPM]